MIHRNKKVDSTIKGFKARRLDGFLEERETESRSQMSCNPINKEGCKEYFIWTKMCEVC